MGALDTLRRWLAPILNPFSELPRHLTTIQQNHQSTLNSFETLMAGLVTFPPSDQQFAGPAADDAIQFVEEYLRAEHSISAPEGILDQISTATATCADDVEIATENLASAAEDDSVLFEVTEAVDIVDVAQGGLDPVTDIPGIILTVVSAAAIIGALTAFGWAIYDAVQTWIRAMNRAASTPYPHPPKTGTSQTPRNSLTPEQEKLAERLHNDYAHLGLSLDDIRRSLRRILI